MANTLEEASYARDARELRLREEIEAARGEAQSRARVHAEEMSHTGELLLMRLRQEEGIANAALRGQQGEIARQSGAAELAEELHRENAALREVAEPQRQ
eukprot:8934258-Alexandrium_andersonii.AAC.1